MVEKHTEIGVSNPVELHLLLQLSVWLAGYVSLHLVAKSGSKQAQQWFP